jgi:Domain of unknown function (DUF1996)/Domain of unknown function (DUF4124)
MQISPNRKQISTLSILTISLMLASSLANADIYKWRNNRGVIQYSDKPPVAGFTKATQHEIVNSLQSKDLCVEPTAKTATAAVRKFMANFSAASTRQVITVFNQPINNAPIVTATAPRPTVVVTAPSIPVPSIQKPLYTAPVPTTPKPVVTTPVPVTPKPVVTAPAPAAPKPTNVATAPTTTIPTPATSPPASTTQNIVQKLLMPAVDINKNVIAASGYSTLRLQATSLATASVPGEGAFRIPCAVSHMSNDDPIVYPNQQGAAHHHTFFGNTSTNYASNVGNMSAVGNSTCAGGIANRSAYWMPSMIDTTTNTPISDIDALFYYKTGYGGVPTNLIVPPPKGLRMISGNSKATTADTAKVSYACIGNVITGWTPNIQNCNAGDVLEMSVSFPQCWDGKNLDSPDHISHMANSGNFPTANKCPTTHPVALPQVTFNAKFKVTKAWRVITTLLVCLADTLAMQIG